MALSTEDFASELGREVRPFGRSLERRPGVSREAVAFWDVHEIADTEHSGRKGADG